MALHNLKKKIELLNQITNLAEKADEKLTDSLRGIAMEISEQKLLDVEYAESQANWIPLAAGFVSSLFAPRSEFARRFAIKLIETIDESEAKLKRLKEKTETSIPNMSARELYAFFKNPGKLLKRSTE